jgi:hypothetical protein
MCYTRKPESTNISELIIVNLSLGYCFYTYHLRMIYDSFYKTLLIETGLSGDRIKMYCVAGIRAIGIYRFESIVVGL